MDRPARNTNRMSSPRTTPLPEAGNRKTTPLKTGLSRTVTSHGFCLSQIIRKSLKHHALLPKILLHGRSVVLSRASRPVLGGRRPELRRGPCGGSVQRASLAPGWRERPSPKDGVPWVLEDTTWVLLEGTWAGPSLFTPTPRGWGAAQETTGAVGGRVPLGPAVS